MVFDARGNGDGGVSPTLVGGHQATISDYTAIIVGMEDGMDNNRITYGLDSYNQTIGKEVIAPLRASEGGDTKPMILEIEDDSVCEKQKSEGEERL